MQSNSVKSSRWVLALLIGSTFALSGAKGSQGETLEEAVRLAVSTNPEVLELAADRRAVNYELRQARGGFFPSVDFRGATGEEFTDSPTTRTREAPLDNGEVWLWRNDSALTIRQLIFDGFETQSEVDRQKARVDSAAYRVGDTAETIGLNATLAYLDVARWRVLVGIAEDNVRAHEATLRDVRRLAEAGRGTVGDVSQAESRLAAARETLVRTEGSLRDVEANYIRLVGQAPADLVRPVLTDADLPYDREGAVDLAVRNNPAVLVFLADIETARAERRAADAPFFPRLDLEITGEANKNIDGVRGFERQLTAQAVMRYNLYRGGTDTAARQEQVERIIEAERALDRIRREVAEEARLAWHAMMTARGRVETLRDQVEANENVVNAYREQFLVARRFLLDLLDSQNELFQSRSALATQDYAALFAAHRVLAAGGTLLSTLGVERPEDARPGGEDKTMAPETAEPTPEETAEASEAEMAPVASE